MQSDIELRQMRYFLAVAEERSFTRASRRCHVAQSSLSRQICALERSLGTRLFDRLPREIRITAAGRIFEQEASLTLEHCRRSVFLVQALEREKKRLLKIGLSALSDLPRMQALVKKAQKGAPESSVERSQATTADLLLALLRGKLDLAMVDLPVVERGIGVLPIHSEPLIAVLPQGHPLSGRPMVRLFELKKERFALLSGKVDPALSAIEGVLRQVGISSLHTVSSVVEQLDYVAVERSVGLMRASAGRLRRDGVLSKPLAHSTELETAIAWRTDDRNPTMVSFRDALIAFAQRQSET